jgi:hypothetical protein
MKLQDMIEDALARTITDPELLRNTLANIMATELPTILSDVANDFETEGCQNCGTVSVESNNKLRKLVGFEPLDVLSDGEVDRDEEEEEEDGPAGNDPAGDDGFETTGEDE